MSVSVLHPQKTASLPKILIVYTGGTFGMKQNSKGVLESFPLTELLDFVPEISRLDCGIDLYSMPIIKDSSNIDASDWQAIAAVLIHNYPNYGAFVILHGTDTMAFTSSAISFMLRGIEKPIIFTGAQLPLDQIRNDARENLITSLWIAQDHILQKIYLPEVCICFGVLLLRANRATKIQNQDFEAFETFNFPPLATIGTEIKYNLPVYKEVKEKKFSLSLNLKVALLKYYPSMSIEILKSFLNKEHSDVVILETFGSGNLPENEGLYQIMETFIAEGGKIYNVSQCLGGTVKQSTYQLGSKLEQIGLLGLGDMSSEAALTKAMILSSNGSLREMTENICGELSV